MTSNQARPFGEVLRDYRRAAGLTQEALAERAGVSARAIADLERGVNRTPRKDTLRLLAEALMLAPTAWTAFDAAAARRHAPGTPARLGDEAERPGGGVRRLAGRRREVLLLERHLAGDGPPGLLLAGEPGVGKSRLLHEASRRAAGHGWVSVHGGCSRWGGQGSYAPVVSALERHVRGCAPGQLRGELRGCAWLVRLLPELAARPIEPLPAWTVAAEHERRLTFGAVGRFLANMAGPSGTLLILDDLHWAGADGLELLSTLLRAASDLRLRVVGAYRDTALAPSTPLATTLADLAHAGLLTQHAVEPLALEDAADLLADLLVEEGAGLEHAVQERVLQRAGGVPFFLVSYAASLHRGAESGGGDAVPWDVMHSIRQRVAALPDEAQALLGVAAVAGRRTARSLLFQVVARPEGAVVAALDAACAARLLEEAGQTTYRFVHDVIREVVEASLGAARRSVLHRDIALALEALSGDPPVEEVAYHYAQSEEHAQAALWLERAGDRAAAEYAHAAALQHYLAAREKEQSSRAEPVALTRLDEKLGDLHLLVGAYRTAAEDFARARGGARDPSRRAELWRKEGVSWEHRGNRARALTAFDAAGGEQGVSSSVLAAVELSRGMVHRDIAEYDAADAAAERARALVRERPPGTSSDLTLARLTYLQGRVAYDRGDMARSEALLEQSLALWEDIGGSQSDIAEGSLYLGWTLVARGAYVRARECYQRSLAVFERIGDQHGIALCCLFMGGLAADGGETDRAEEWHRRSRAIATATADQGLRAYAATSLGWLALLRGALDRADEFLHEGLAYMEASGDQWGMAWCWGGLGQVAQARGNLVGAEPWYQRSRVEMERLGQHAGVRDAVCQLASLARERGDLIAAEASLGDILTRSTVTDDRITLAHSLVGLAEVACERGLVIAAARLSHRGRRMAQRMGQREWEVRAVLAQARTLVRACQWSPPPEARLRRAATLLEHSRTLAAAHGFAWVALQATLLLAEFSLQRGMSGAAEGAAEEAWRLARDQGRSRETALASRLLGQCALASNHPRRAETHLRSALGQLTEIGAALEAARTRLVLAGALMSGAGERDIPEEARMLLREARDQFAASGAVLDLAHHERLVEAGEH